MWLVAASSSGQKRVNCGAIEKGFHEEAFAFCL
jgi:hypothetical protein